MIIASKLPPEHTNRTFFNSGRRAFAYLIDQVVHPRKVYLPTFTCWSLVSTMQRRFPDIEVEFYPDAQDALWMEAHSLAIPVSSNYSVDDMQRIVQATKDWQHAECGI